MERIFVCFWNAARHLAVGDNRLLITIELSRGDCGIVQTYIFRRSHRSSGQDIMKDYQTWICLIVDLLYSGYKCTIIISHENESFPLGPGAFDMTNCEFLVISAVIKPRSLFPTN